MPAAAHTPRAKPTEPPDWRSTAAGTKKMPEPITLPTTMETRSPVESVRLRVVIVHQLRAIAHVSRPFVVSHGRPYVAKPERPPQLACPFAMTAPRSFGYGRTNLIGPYHMAAPARTSPHAARP